MKSGRKESDKRGKEKENLHPPFLPADREKSLRNWEIFTENAAAILTNNILYTAEEGNRASETSPNPKTRELAGPDG